MLALWTVPNPNSGHLVSSDIQLVYLTSMSSHVNVPVCKTLELGCNFLWSVVWFPLHTIPWCCIAPYFADISCQCIIDFKWTRGLRTLS